MTRHYVTTRDELLDAAQEAKQGDVLDCQGAKFSGNTLFLLTSILNIKTDIVVTHGHFGGAEPTP